MSKYFSGTAADMIMYLADAACHACEGVGEFMGPPDVGQRVACCTCQGTGFAKSGKWRLIKDADVSNWLPIEHAPRDGSNIYVYDARGNIMVAYWKKRYIMKSGWVINSFYAMRDHSPRYDLVLWSPIVRPEHTEI